MALNSTTVGFLYTIGIGLAVFAVLYILFLRWQKQLPTIFDHRNYLSRIRDPDFIDYDNRPVTRVHPRPRTGLLGWFRSVQQVSHDDIKNKISYDALLFLQFIENQRWCFIAVALITAIVLMPVYATGGGGQEGLDRVSTGNIAGKARLWATLIFDYIVVAVFLFKLWTDYAKFAELRREYRSRINPANYTLVVQDIPKDQNSTTSIREFLERLVPGNVSEVVRVRDAGFLQKMKVKYDKAVMGREKAEWVRANKGPEKARLRPGFCGFCMCWKRKVDAVEYWESEQMKWQTAAEGGREKVGRTQAAIVLLATRKAASFLAQSNFASNSYEWNVSRAGEPNDVHWNAFKIPRYQVPWRRAAVLVAVMLLTFFWIIPATAIAGLASSDGLISTSAFSWLKPVFESSALGALISGVLPSIILSVIVSLIPTFIRMMVKQERLHTLHHIDAKTRTYFYVFNIFGQFLFITCLSAGLKDLQKMIDDPGIIPTTLGETIPKSGTFFATFIILNTFIPFAKQLATPARVIVRWIKLKFLAKTERQQRAVELGGNDFPYFRMYGLTMLISLLGIIYMTLSPVVGLCAMAFYLVGYPVFKYQISYMTYRGWDGGGYDYRGAFWGIVVGLLVKQLTMAGYYGVKKAPAQAILSAIPCVAIALISVLCVRRYGSVVKHGSLTDVAEDEGKGVPPRYLGLYEHPGLKEITEGKDLEELADYDSGSTDGDVRDVEAMKPSYTNSKVVD